MQGGQGARITQITHNPAVGHQALLSFQHGVHGAFLAGCGLLFAAAAVAFVGMRRVPAASPAGGHTAAIEV